MEEKGGQLLVFMEEGANSQVFMEEGPKTLLTCNIAMESKKMIICGGLELYSSAKAHIQV